MIWRPRKNPLGAFDLEIANGTGERGRRKTMKWDLNGARRNLIVGKETVLCGPARPSAEQPAQARSMNSTTSRYELIVGAWEGSATALKGRGAGPLVQSEEKLGRAVVPWPRKASKSKREWYCVTHNAVRGNRRKKRHGKTCGKRHNRCLAGDEVGGEE